MKKLILAVILVVIMSGIALAQEGHGTRWVVADNDSTNWTLNKYGDQDTSKAFPLYSEHTWKGFFNDTSGTRNDSCHYKVSLFTSSYALATWDSTITFAQTIFNSTTDFDGDSAVAFWGGPTRPKSIFAAPERWGYLIVEVLATGSQVSNAIVGRMYVNGWSNQDGATLTKVGR